MATAVFEVPEVYKALAEILKSLSVAKGGTLPGNMGGKPYITAVDASAEVKRQFVANDLIFLPNEEVVKHENLTVGNSLKVAIVIRGEYTIISTKDASQVAISGTGDGLATGTAVASNIASTNALKNALLRAFLITEQSVEDAAKNGEQPTTGEKQASAANERVVKARQNTAVKSQDGKPLTVDEVKTAIRVDYIDSGKVSTKALNDARDALMAGGKMDGAGANAKILELLKAGEELPR